jgi:hypothetical protein
MTGWEWWAGPLDDDCYWLANEPTREAVIAQAMHGMSPGEQFRIVEARSSSDRRYEGSDFVPFLRTRNHEIITVGAVASAEVDNG